jgi:hypothetical protein
MQEAYNDIRKASKSTLNNGRRIQIKEEKSLREKAQMGHVAKDSTKLMEK